MAVSDAHGCALWLIGTSLALLLLSFTCHVIVYQFLEVINYSLRLWQCFHVGSAEMPIGANRGRTDKWIRPSLTYPPGLCRFSPLISVDSLQPYSIHCRIWHTVHARRQK